MKKLTYAWILCILLLAGCSQDEDAWVAEENEMITISYQVSLEDGRESRTIGDGCKIDELVVGIFREGKLLTTRNFTDNDKDGKFQNVTIPMMQKETYDLVFWAQTKENGIYTISDNFDININYDAYGHTLQNVENYDAFAGKQEGVSVANPGNKDIMLARPFAQLNVGESSDFASVSQAVMQVQGVPNVYNPWSGSVTGAETCEFTFENITPISGDLLETEEGKYHYLATAYLLPVDATEVKVMIHQGNKVHTLELDEVTLTSNQRTNIVGNFLE